MDQNTALKILQNYGAPPTAANLSKVMSQSDSDSAVLGRSMGLQGGGQEQGNADNLSMLLDKLDSSTARPTSPDSGVAQAAPAETPASTVASAAAAAPQAVTPPVPQTQAPPLPVANGVAPGEGAPITPNGGGGDLMKWLLPLLGISAGGAAVGGAAPAMPGARAALPGPDMNVPRLEGPRTQIEGPRRALPRMIDNDGGGDKSSAEVPQVQRQIEGPSKVPQIEDAGGKRFEGGAPEIKNPPKPAPVRPSFSPTELLMQAVQDFRKGFRK